MAWVVGWCGCRGVTLPVVCGVVCCLLLVGVVGFPVGFLA